MQDLVDITIDAIVEFFDHFIVLVQWCLSVMDEIFVGNLFCHLHWDDLAEILKTLICVVN